MRAKNTTVNRMTASDKDACHENEMQISTMWTNRTIMMTVVNTRTVTTAEKTRTMKLVMNMMTRSRLTTKFETVVRTGSANVVLKWTMVMMQYSTDV